jgi:hypothetical protein
MNSENFYSNFTAIFEGKKHNFVLTKAEYDEMTAFIKNPSKIGKDDHQKRNWLRRL